MDAALQALTSRLQQAGIDPATPLEYGATPLAEHAQRLAQPVAPWLEPLASYVEALHARGLSLWSPLHFCVPYLAPVAGARPERLDALLRAVLRLLLTLEDRNIDRTRAEQYGIRAAATALGPEPDVLLDVLAFATRVAEAGADPGWLMQTAIPAAWNVAGQDASVLRELLGTLERTATQLRELDVSPGYPFSMGIAALGTFGPAARSHLGAWLERVMRMARSLHGSGQRAYALLEHGLGGLGRPDLLEPELVTQALDIGVALCDRGLDPTPTLHAGFTSTDVPPRISLDVAAELARSGIQPLFVLTHGLPAALAPATRPEPWEERVARVVALAKALHAAGHGLRLTFEDGLPCSAAMSEEYPGLLEHTLTLAEQLVAKGMDPGTFLAHGLPRGLGRSDRQPWTADECLELSRELIALGVNPEPALSYAVPSLFSLCGSDSGRFRTLRRALTDLIATLHGQGLDSRDVLFHDVQWLADAGGQPHAFADLLVRLQGLLGQLEARGVDPRPFLREGLPIAAREASGKPWVLVATFEAAGRWVEAGRGAEVAALLAQGTTPLVQSAGEDAGAFERLLLSLERRFPALPGPLVGPAVSAACLLAGTRPELLEQALQVIQARLDRPALDATESEVALALPGLAAMAERPEALVPLMDAAVTATALLPEEGPLRGLLLRQGLGAIAEVTEKDSRTAARLLPELARALLRWPLLAPALLRHGAYPVARHARHQPEGLLQGLEALARWAQALDVKDPNHALAIERAVALCGAVAGNALPAFLEALTVLGDALPEPGLARRALFQELGHAHVLVSRWPEAWSRLVAPTLRAHRHRAGAVLAALSQLGERHIHSPSDLDVLRDIVTQAGVRAEDLLLHLVRPALRQGVVEDLGTDRELLQRYLREVAFPDARMYARYRDIQKDPHLSEAEKRVRSAGLREEIHTLQQALRQGALAPEQEQSPLLGVALAHLFPPALGVTRRDYVELYQRMADRPGDVEGLGLPPELRRRRYTLARGSWQLREDAALDRSPWELVLGVLGELPPNEEEPAAALGWALLLAWNEGRLGRGAGQRELLGRLLARMKRGGLVLPTEARTAAQLLAVRELLADQLRDVVEEVLLAARAEDGERFRRLVEDKLAPPVWMGPGLIKAVQGTVDAVQAGTLAREEADARLARQLHAFDVDDASALLGLLLLDPSPEATRKVLATLQPRPVELEPGKEVHRLHADFVGQLVQAMHRELHGGPGQPGALEYRASSESLELALELTKRKAHAAVGFCEGVCVATDVSLWNRPEFLQCVFWDEEGIARGGMHLLLVEEAGRRYLTLPGINPAVRLLDRVEASVFLDAVVDYSWRLARALGLHGVWVPASRSIHSNRQAIHEELEVRDWPARATQPHEFSQEPYHYTIHQVVEAPERYLPEEPLSSPARGG